MGSPHMGKRGVGIFYLQKVAVHRNLLLELGVGGGGGQQREPQVLFAERIVQGDERSRRVGMQPPELRRHVCERREAVGVHVRIVQAPQVALDGAHEQRDHERAR